MMVTAKAIGFDRFGDVDVFEERTEEIALNSTNNVLVKVKKVGINPVEAFVRSGKMSRSAAPAQFQVLGNEVVGEVVKLYDNPSNLSIGDNVIVKPGAGGYADYLTTNERNVFKVPAEMPLDFAAGFSATASTAYWALYGGFYDLKKGDTLAVVGASGSVGNFVVQLAKSFGVTIIALASAHNEAYLKESGAAVFIDYRDSDAVAAYANKADFVVDTSLFNKGEKVALQLVKEGGTYLGMTTLPQDTLGKNVKVVFLSRTPAMTNAVVMPFLFKFYEEHGLTLKIAETLPLTVAGVQAAHRLIVSDRAAGKIILTTED